MIISDIHFEEFKKVLDRKGIKYVEMSGNTLIIRNEGKINIRMYKDKHYSSSWISEERFKDKMKELLQI